MGRKPLLETAEYYDLLRARAKEVDIWETEYLQALEGEDAVLEWVSGTGLRPILEGLQGEERDAFLERYRGRLRELYPRAPMGARSIRSAACSSTRAPDAARRALDRVASRHSASAAMNSRRWFHEGRKVGVGGSKKAGSTT